MVSFQSTHADSTTGECVPMLPGSSIVYLNHWFYVLLCFLSFRWGRSGVKHTRCVNSPASCERCRQEFDSSVCVVVCGVCVCGVSATLSLSLYIYIYIYILEYDKYWNIMFNLFIFLSKNNDYYTLLSWYQNIFSGIFRSRIITWH